MTRPKIGKCKGCGRRRPIRRVDVQDGRDVYRCGDCVPWGEGVAAIDHEVISADEDGLIADGGERVDGDEVAHGLLEGVGRAAYLRDYCFGIKPGQSGVTWDPIYPYHRAPRECPFCGQIYRRHAGFADHRDNCEEGPNPGANPVSVGGDSA